MWASLKDFLWLQRRPVVRLAQLFLAGGIFFRVSYKPWTTHICLPFQDAWQVSFPMMLLGFIAPGEDVCLLLGSWLRTGGIDVGLLGKC